MKPLRIRVTLNRSILDLSIQCGRIRIIPSMPSKEQHREYMRNWRKRDPVYWRAREAVDALAMPPVLARPYQSCLADWRWRVVPPRSVKHLGCMDWKPFSEMRTLSQ